jgi:hypothetical protein
MWPFDQNNQPAYQQYASAYDTGNVNGVDPYQAFGHIQQFMQSAPFDMQQNIYQQHFAQMPYEQRAFLAQQIPPQYGLNPNNPAAMAQGFARFGQEQPGMLSQILSHPFLLGSGVLLAGLIAKHMITQHERREYEYREMPPFGGNPYAQNWGGDPAYREERAAHHEEREARREFERAEFNPNPFAAAEERREARRDEHEARRDEREAHWDRERGW